MLVSGPNHIHSICSLIKPCVCVCAGNYRTQLYDKQREEYLPATQGLGMFVEVKDPDDKVSIKFMYLKSLCGVMLSWLTLNCTATYASYVKGPQIKTRKRQKPRLRKSQAQCQSQARINGGISSGRVPGTK